VAVGQVELVVRHKIKLAQVELVAVLMEAQAQEVLLLLTQAVVEVAVALLALTSPQMVVLVVLVS
jgi:hypothetical protein